MGSLPSEVIRGAQFTETTYGVPASVTLAQWILESNWGESLLSSKYNNYFGITAGSNWNGETVYMTNKNGTDGQTYRVYNNGFESIVDHAKILLADRYTQYTSTAKTLEEYVEGIKKGGYATDTNYVSKVMNIINSNNLTQYDGKATITDSKANPEWYKNLDDYETPTIETTIVSDTELKWWGDIIVMIICVLLIGLAIVFLVLAFNGGSPKNMIKKTLSNKAVKGVTTNE